MARRSAAEVEAAIHKAILEELAHGGYQGVTFEGVAARAHTSKPVVYRRYATRAELVAGAIMDTASLTLGEPEGPDLRSDLQRLGRRLRGRFEEFGFSVVAGILAEATPALADMAQRNTGLPAVKYIDAALSRARDRGEAVRKDPTERQISATADIFFHYLVFTRSLPDEVIESVVDEVSLPLLLENGGKVEK
ncbi:TetR/AcrR family transcriptional regulator [Corynebacterium sp. c8Ua_181]|uniref:TetR/AcrR family transcriptional regulator n=1 Tax=Corynebacterium curieae TaxID=2913500 RepID=A0A9X3MBW7_9CORY|nr:TetR/AcrR family transcriptional regulator [Corynebacterium curieae]MCZ9306478.1 TetR/AcrR family transcriptional regulator [Corynebacterium curieae]MDV2423953.1 TetR/AcrR family transcriptional regulator [Corynebacterium curieae]